MTKRAKTKRVAVTGITMAAMREAAQSDPARLHCRTLSDMSEREIKKLERHYGCPVIRPERAG